MGEDIRVLRNIILAVLLVALLLMITYMLIVKGVNVYV